MAVAQPLQMLLEEHRIVASVLAALETKLQDLERQPFPKEFIEQALDFLSNFTDRCHLPKEEDRLFPLLWEKGMPLEKGPLGALMDEHQAGRRHLDEVRAQLTVAEQGSAEAVAAVRAALSAYVQFIRQHMQKEEQRVFNVARRLLDRHDMARLEREFEELEREQIGPAVHLWYGTLALRLSEAARRQP